jgi:hypothetical protein
MGGGLVEIKRAYKLKDKDITNIVDNAFYLEKDN